MKYKTNSKKINLGDTFVALRGIKNDGHKYVESAIQNGATSVVVEEGTYSIPSITVDDSREYLANALKKEWDSLKGDFHLIGVTGTDGKTSVATITQTLLGNDKCGYLGTNGFSYGEHFEDTPNTTPEIDTVYSSLEEMVNHNCRYGAIEVSSEAIHYGRVRHMEFDVAILTNITTEHLNTHGTLENYIACKCELFKQTKGFCILNHDDKHYETVLKACKGTVLTYGMDKDNDLAIKDIKLYPDHTTFNIVYKNEIYKIESPLLGDFNVYNLCASMLACLVMGIKIEDIMKRIPKIKISGRLHMVRAGQDFYVMVDYAHTTNGITQLLKFVHLLDINRSIVVMGSAGERDHSKRPLIGEVLLKNATHTIFTYEDPRSEDPMDIIKDLLKNAGEHHNYEIVLDRSEAIKKAVFIAQPNDMILILGKGNETYEKLKDKTIYFNDVEEVTKYIKERIKQ